MLMEFLDKKIDADYSRKTRLNAIKIDFSDTVLKLIPSVEWRGVLPSVTEWGLVSATDHRKRVPVGNKWRPYYEGLVADNQMVLGKGSYGKVKTGEADNFVVHAIKRVALGTEGDEDYSVFTQTVREAFTADRLSGHPNILDMVSVSAYSDGKGLESHGMRVPGRVTKVAIAMPQGGESGLAVMNNPAVSFSRKLMFFAEVLGGLIRLHDHGLFHGDLKLQNTVLGLDDNKAKVMDLGLAGNVGISTSHLVSFSIEALGGTYPPPEVIKVRAMAASISEIDLSKIDIFAWGADFVEFITATFCADRLLYRPDHNNMNYDPVNEIVVLDHNRVASICPPHQVFKFIEDAHRVTTVLRNSGNPQQALLATLIDGCIDPDPKTRIPAAEALAQLMVIIHA